MAQTNATRPRIVSLLDSPPAMTRQIAAIIVESLSPVIATWRFEPLRMIKRTQVGRLVEPGTLSMINLGQFEFEDRHSNSHYQRRR